MLSSILIALYPHHFNSTQYVKLTTYLLSCKRFDFVFVPAVCQTITLFGNTAATHTQKEYKNNLLFNSLTQLLTFALSFKS